MGERILERTLRWRDARGMQARTRRVLRTAPRVPINSATGGAVARLAGRIELGQEPALRAPFSGRECVLFHAVVERRIGDQWRSVLDIRENLDTFWIVDETGRALVDARSPSTVLTMDYHLRRDGFGNLPIEVLRVLRRHGVDTATLARGATVDLLEGLVAASETVVVLGSCQREPDPDPSATPGGYRDSATRIVVRQPPGAPITISARRTEPWGR